MYNMKNVTASEARKNWFQLLDEVAAGAVVQIERNGRRLVLRCEPFETVLDAIPSYDGIFSDADRTERADRWGWSWSPEELQSLEL